MKLTTTLTTTTTCPITAVQGPNRNTDHLWAKWIPISTESLLLGREVHSEEWRCTSEMSASDIICLGSVHQITDMIQRTEAKTAKTKLNEVSSFKRNVFHHPPDLVGVHYIQPATSRLDFVFIDKLNKKHDVWVPGLRLCSPTHYKQFKPGSAYIVKDRHCQKMANSS